MNRKVILLGPYPPPHGGVSIYISALFDVLKDRGVHLWTYGDQEIRGPNIHFMKDKRREIVPLLLHEGRGARIADCTHFLVEYPSALVPIWVRLKRMLGFEWIKIIQDGTLPSRYQRFSRWRRKLFRIAVGSVDEFVTISAELEHWLREEIRVKQQVSLIRNLFPPNHSAETALSGDLKAALEPFLQRSLRVCSIGVFIPDYGFRDVAEAVEQLRRETREDIGLVLVDGDFAGDQDYKSEVLRGREWIVVVKNVAHAQVFEVLGRSHVFVRGVGLEGYGLSRVEAIWSGLPVVATRVGETRGMLLYDFGNVSELAAQLKRALFEDRQQETREWAERYRTEAEENLRAIITKLGVEESQSR